MTSFGIHGYLGSGKGVLAAKILRNFRILGYPICSNENLNPYFFPNKIPLDLDYFYRLAVTGQSLPIPRLALYVDELQYYAHARTHQEKGQLIMSFLEIQGRKRHIKYIYTSKKRRMIDVLLRDIDLIYHCSKYHKFLENNKLVLDHTKCFDDECVKPHWFEYVMIDNRNFRGKKFKITNPEPLYRLYNTEKLTAPISAFSEDAIKKAIMEMKSS